MAQKVDFDALPDSAFIREAQLVQSAKGPDLQAPLPFSSSTYRRKVRAGTFPKPIKLSERVAAQNVGECRAVIAAMAAGKSEAEIRVLVNRLHAKRAALACARGEVLMNSSQQEAADGTCRSDSASPRAARLP